MPTFHVQFIEQTASPKICNVFHPDIWTTQSGVSKKIDKGHSSYLAVLRVQRDTNPNISMSNITLHIIS
jgi:hypothetical protein